MTNETQPDDETQPDVRSVLSEDGAAAYLELAPRTLEHWRYLGKGPKFSKLGKGKRARVRYRLQDLDEFVAKHLRAGTHGAGKASAGKAGKAAKAANAGEAA